MYARDLSVKLHSQLASKTKYNTSVKRFEALRGYGMLPKGRDNARQRLTDSQIASAVLGYTHEKPGYAGHASLLFGQLQPVGGIEASYKGGKDLKSSIAFLIGNKAAVNNLINITLSIIREGHQEEYLARILFNNGKKRYRSYYVSKYAISKFQKGAEKSFDYESQINHSSKQLVLGKKFFRELNTHVEVSRKLNLPFQSDYREYKTEEEKNEFYKKLGAKRNSNFLNLRVDTQVTWPKEPTRISFEGYNIILFPKDKKNSHSISIDLKQKGLDSLKARTIMSRFLSILSWCDNQYAVLQEGWSGGHVPQTVSKKDYAFATTHHWGFYRSIPENKDLLKCLAYYREGLNAGEAGLINFEIVSFYKVFETKFKSRNPEYIQEWINEVFDDATRDIPKEILSRFNKDLNEDDVGSYIHKKCRVATAHYSLDHPSDPDEAPEIIRLANAAWVIKSLARYYIKTDFEISELYFSDSIK